MDKREDIQEAIESLLATTDFLAGLSNRSELARGLACYLSLLQEWNKRVNLTGVRDLEEMMIALCLDSLAVADLIGPDARGIDIGTGAGLPGIPLALAYPELRMVLLDSVGKKTAFCRHASEVLVLGKRVEVLQARAEEAAHQPGYRGVFDLAVSKAVAELPTLYEYALPFLKVGGRLIAWKGPDPEEEIRGGEKAREELGGGVPRIRRYELPGGWGSRTLIVVEKKRPTSGRYPRRVGVPGRRPIV